MSEIAQYLAMAMIEDKEDFHKALNELSGLPISISDKMSSIFFNKDPEDINFPMLENGEWVFRYTSRVAEGVCEASFGSLLEAMNFAFENNHL